MNFTIAKNVCELNGYRLCTMNEVMSLCDINNCNLNERGIWTKSECTPHYWQRRSGGNINRCRSGSERNGNKYICKMFTMNDILIL